jgi:arylsulfatase A-like enzyme
MLCLAASFLTSAAHAQDKTAKTRRPNVLFLFTDDQRADTVGALGNPHIITPNLDALARRGFVFNNAYCLGANAGAVCRPSRNMLLSGRSYFRFGGSSQASPKKPTFPKSMKAAGYETYHHGKRGNSAKSIHPQFDHTHYLPDGQARALGEPGKLAVDDAIAFLADRKDTRPFFMYLAFATPHDPRVAAKKYLDMYERSKIPLPKNYLPVHPFDNGEMTIRDERLEKWPRTKDAVRRHLHDYYAVITGLDHHIGRLIASLKKSGQFDNTIIIFSSDHGLAIGSHGLMGKQNVYEDGMKAPLIFAGPGIPQGKTDALVYLHDIYPTVCDLSGAKIPAGLDGRSLAPVIAGKRSGVRDSLFTSYQKVQRAVRDDRWKLIRYPQINKSQLFDLQTDPHETNNLADNPSHAAKLKQMTSLLVDWQKKLGDTQPLVVENPKNPAFDASKLGPAKKRKKKKKQDKKAA